jgi:hypothetical protein
MSRLSWQNDPHGCRDDYLNEQIAEAMHAAHLDEHEAYPQKGCEWCEAAAKAEQEEAEADSGRCAVCPICGHRRYHRCPHD